MKNILIPGTGCYSVDRFEQDVKVAAEEHGIPIGLEKAEDLVRILSFQILSLLLSFSILQSLVVGASFLALPRPGWQSEPC